MDAQLQVVHVIDLPREDALIQNKQRKTIEGATHILLENSH